MSIAHYAKTVVAGLLAGLYALQAALSEQAPGDPAVTPMEWLGIAIAVIGV